MNRNQGETEKIGNGAAEVQATPSSAAQTSTVQTPARADKPQAHTRDATAVLRSLFFGGLYALFGYLLGGCALPFGAYPLGVAWLCAANRRVPYIFIGLCLSALALPQSQLYILSYVVVFALRVIVRMTLDRPQGEAIAPREHTLGQILSSLFGEQLALRMTTACIGVFFVGVYRLWSRGFLYYDLYGTLLGIVVAPTAVLLFSGVNRARTAEKKDISRIIGLLTLFSAVVYAARELHFLYVSVAAFGAMCMALYMTKREGIVKGVLTGTLCGLAYLPTLAPLFAFGALCVGLLMPTSVTLATLATVAVGSAWALYTTGLGALTGVLPAILSASVLFFVVDKLFGKEDVAKETVDAKADAEEAIACRVLDASEMDGIHLSDTAGRVKTVCESFSEMAQLFETMGRTLQRPSPEELYRICDNAFDASCASCPTKESCAQGGRTTDTEIGRLSSLLHREGRVSVADVSESLVARCSRLPDILDEINHNAGLHAARMLQSDKTEIFSTDYAAMATILAETMTAEQEEYHLDAQASERLVAALQACEIGIVGVMVWGEAQRNLIVRSRAALDERECERVLAVIRDELGLSMAIASMEEREDGMFDTRFAPRERLSLRVARRTCRAEGEEEYCGDSVGVFSRDNMQYAYISDGMGSGREAALTAGICSLFLQKMLGADNRCETVLRMLNGFLRNKGSGSLHECSATVDLMALNLLDGRATFYKCGAAPTYVLRDGSLFKIRSKTLPIGILRETDQKKISFDIHPSDVIVMVSDGVTQGREECPWLFDLLRHNVERVGIEATADLIVRHAKTEGSTDDLSVLILRAEDAKK